MWGEEGLSEYDRKYETLIEKKLMSVTYQNFKQIPIQMKNIYK